MKKIQLENQAIGPFPAMIVGAMAGGKPTYTTVGAGGCACLDPVLCVSLKDTHYITEAIDRASYFSVNIPSTALIKEMDFCGMASGKEVDKSGLFTSFFDTAGQAPMIEECPLNFLCRVCDKKKIHDFTMFFGDIAAAFVNGNCLTKDKPDPIKIDPIIMMGFHYCNLEKIIGQPFAEGKNLTRKTKDKTHTHFN